GSVLLRAQWIGRTNATHFLTADWLDGNPTPDVTPLWFDTTAFSRNPFTAAKEFPASQATAGVNRLRIQGRNSTAVPGSQSGFNWFGSPSPRLYQARNGRLELNTGSATDTVEISIDGFAGATPPPFYVYDVTDRADPARLTVDPSQVTASGGGWRLTLQT